MTVSCIYRGGCMHAERCIDHCKADRATAKNPPQASNLRSLSDRLLDAQVASCSCLTKTPEVKYHDPMCRFRLFYEAWAALNCHSVTLNGFQARMILKFIDGDDECSLEVADLPDRTADNGDRLAAGLYVWLSDYPEEGCLLLTEEPTAEGFCAEPKVAVETTTKRPVNTQQLLQDYYVSHGEKLGSWQRVALDDFAIWVDDGRPVAETGALHRPMDDSFLVECARDAGFSDPQWKAMFFDKQPYDVTYATSAMRRFVDLVLERLQSAVKAPVAHSFDANGGEPA